MSSHPLEESFGVSCVYGNNKQIRSPEGINKSSIVYENALLLQKIDKYINTTPLKSTRTIPTIINHSESDHMEEQMLSRSIACIARQEGFQRLISFFPF